MIGVKAFSLAFGVSLVGYSSGTPGSQWWASLAGGALLGVFVALTERR